MQAQQAASTEKPTRIAGQTTASPAADWIASIRTWGVAWGETAAFSAWLAFLAYGL
jgi:hypothetical protein